MLTISVLYVLISFILSFMLAMMMIPRILLIAQKHSLYDSADSRKVHSGQIPRLGGISFFPSILFAVAFSIAIFYISPPQKISPYIAPNIAEFCLFLCGALLLYLAGIKDDLMGLRYKYKFIIQFCAAILLVMPKLYINNLYGLFGIHELPVEVGVPLTIFVIVFVVNAINLIDGIDGLAAGLGILALGFHGVLFLWYGLFVYACIAFAAIGVLLPFFYYNVFGSTKRNHKIFMGDSGSLTLGFTLIYIAIRYMYESPDMLIPKYNALVAAASPLLIPVLDVLRVMLTRIKKHQNIFLPDRNHIHHKLLDLGFSNHQALIFLLVLSGCFSLMNLLLAYILGNTEIFLLDIVLWVLINVYFSYILRRRKLIVLNSGQ